jgi:uncharacterized protein DUF6286
MKSHGPPAPSDHATESDGSTGSTRWTAQIPRTAQIPGAAQTGPALTTGDPTHAEPPGQKEPAKTPPRRRWAVRRVPAVVAASLILLGAGALLFEAVWVHTGHHATAWWTTLTDEFATRPVNDVWILTGAAVAAALGLCLIVLALTPGLRRQLTLRVPANGHRRTSAVLDRKGAALLLRDTAMRVPGVSSARVRVHRRRVTVRVDARFGDTTDIKDELSEAVGRAEHDQLALAHSPRLAVHVRRNAA